MVAVSVAEGRAVADGGAEAAGRACVTVGAIAVGHGGSVLVGAAKRVTVGGIGVVKAASARFVSGSRLARARPRHSSTSQKAPKSSSTLRTRLRGMRFLSRCMGERV